MLSNIAPANFYSTSIWNATKYTQTFIFQKQKLRDI